MNDLCFHAEYVSMSVERMLHCIDLDPLSPTYGCAHLDFWRDKTSEFADARRQEMAYPLAMLYCGEYPGSSWNGSSRLLRAVEALLTFWSGIQYPSGAFDEWYKGERAFAAPAFSAHAVARTLLLLQDSLLPESAAKFREALRRTASWLSLRDDLFKTNHQAVGIAALAWCAKALEQPELTRLANEKLHGLFKHQTLEGWFPEVGHMDPGYGFLTAEFLALAMQAMGDWTMAPGVAKVFDFAALWLDPDLGLCPHLGVCHNPYVSRIASLLLSQHSSQARTMAGIFQNQTLRPASALHHLQDDLRLSRWAFQPLLAWDLAKVQDSVPDPIEPSWPKACASQPSGILRLGVGQAEFMFAHCAGGIVRLLAKGFEPLEDLGYAVKSQDRLLTNLTYDRSLGRQAALENIQIDAPLVPVKRFFPSFPMRLALRLACVNETGARLARQGIDFIRRRKGSALNQSSANLAGASASRLLRRCELFEDTLVLRDELSFDSPLALGDVSFLLGQGHGGSRLEDLAEGAEAKKSLTRLRVVKRYAFASGKGWSLQERSLELF